MGDMAKSLERDPQLELILANRKRDLGIGFESAAALVGNSPSATASTSAEAGVSDCRTILFSAASTPHYYDR